MEPIIITPGSGGYFSVKRSGKHGFSRFPNAVGSSYQEFLANCYCESESGSILTWTNAVAISTPVPKCLQAKNILGGIFSCLYFFAATGNPAPVSAVLVRVLTPEQQLYLPRHDAARMITTHH